MDNLISESIRDLSLMPAIGLWDLVLSLSTSAVLCIFLAVTYIRSHSGHSYSRSFVHTLVFVGITISLIMLIIGSNIARAFALVGALSIIRFRNPVKDSRDVAFIFMAMAVGMASGTRFYLFAAIFTMFMAFLALVFHHFRFGESDNALFVLRLRMKASERGHVESAFRDLCSSYAIISVDRTAGQGEIDDFVYEINPNRGVEYERIIKRIGEISNDISVTLLVGEASVNV